MIFAVWRAVYDICTMKGSITIAVCRVVYAICSVKGKTWQFAVLSVVYETSRMMDGTWN